MEPPPAKRARVSAQGELPLPMETNQQADHDPLGGLWSHSAEAAAMVARPSDRPWKLPRSQSLAVNEKYLNDQLEHVVAMGLTTTQQQQPRYQRLQRANQDDGDADDEDAFGRLQLNDVWRYVRLMPEPEETSAVARQNKEIDDGLRVETRLRDTMDLVSFLLFLRQDDLERQNGLHETIQRMEKELQRKTNAVQALTAENEMHKQSLAQQENYFTAKEESFKNERKMLQADKKALEVLCAKLQGVETAYKAKLRRKDVDYERLRKTLQDSVTRVSKEKRGSGIILGTQLNGTTERTRLARSGQSHESKLTKQIMDNFEQKKAELLFENEALASSYHALQRQVEALTTQYKKAVSLFLAQKSAKGSNEDLSQLAVVPIDDFTPTALSVTTKQNLPEYIAESMEILGDKIGQFEEAMRIDLAEEAQERGEQVLDMLQQKLADAHGIIHEQDQLLQAALAVSETRRPGRDNTQRSRRRISYDADGSKNGPENDTQNLDITPPRSYRVSPDYSLLETYAEDMEFEKQALARKQKHLEQDRKLLQERAVQLDKDRLEFELAKQEHLFGSPALFNSTLSKDSVTTPSRRSNRAVIHAIESPIVLPVPATPATAAVLKTIGIRTYDDNQNVPGDCTDFFLSPIAKK